MPRIGVTSYSSKTKEQALGLIDSLRSTVILPELTLRGQRYNSNDRVLWNLESNCSEQEFLSVPETFVTYALIDAAKSDYWYANEKFWDDDGDEVDDDSSWDVEE